MKKIYSLTKFTNCKTLLFWFLIIICICPLILTAQTTQISESNIDDPLKTNNEPIKDIDGITIQNEKVGNQNTIDLENNIFTAIEGDLKDYYIGVFIDDQNVFHGENNRLLNLNKPQENSGNNVPPEHNNGDSLLIGKTIKLNGATLNLNFDVDGAWREISPNLNIFGSIPQDSSSFSTAKWVIKTASANLKYKLGSLNLFANGGLAKVRLSDESVINIDVMNNNQGAENTDNDASTRLGMALAVGVEVPLDNNHSNSSEWILRMDGSYLDLKEENNTINPSNSANCRLNENQIGCSHNIGDGEEIGVIKIAFIRRF